MISSLMLAKEDETWKSVAGSGNAGRADGSLFVVMLDEAGARLLSTGVMPAFWTADDI